MPTRRRQGARTGSIEIAAGVLQAGSAIRDLTGLCLFDERGVTAWLRPDRTGRHLTEMLRTLADAAALAPAPPAPTPITCCRWPTPSPGRSTPSCCGRASTPCPFWATWIAGFPGYRRRRRSLLDALHRAKSRLLLRGLFGVPLAVFLLNCILIASGWLPPDVLGPLLLLTMGASLAASAAAVLLFAVSRSFRSGCAGSTAGASGWPPCCPCATAWPPAGWRPCWRTTTNSSLHLQRFLAEHQVPYSLPLYDPAGRYLFAAPEKVDVLAAALLRAVASGHDNELFVLLADLLELDDAPRPAAAGRPRGRQPAPSGAGRLPVARRVGIADPRGSDKRDRERD